MNDMIKESKIRPTDLIRNRITFEKYNKMMLEHHEGHSDTNAGDWDTALCHGNVHASSDGN